LDPSRQQVKHQRVGIDVLHTRRSASVWATQDFPTALGP